MRSMVQSGHCIICKTKGIDDLNGIGYFYSKYQANDKKKYTFLCHLYAAKYLTLQSDIDFMASYENYLKENNKPLFIGRPVAGRNAPGIFIVKKSWQE